jgi:diguanylate cyclase (GGDEF)-like protein
MIHRITRIKSDEVPGPTVPLPTVDQGVTLHTMGSARLDAATLVFFIALLTFSLALLIQLLARSPRSGGRGLQEWSASLALASLAFVLFFFRGTWPWVWSYLVANLLMLMVVPLTMKSYAKLLDAEMPWSSVALSAAVGLSGVCAVYFLETDPQFGVFSMSMAMGFQLVLAMLMVALAPGRQASPWHAVLYGILGLAAAAFLLRAGIALNGHALAVSTIANSPAQVGALCVAALYFMVTTVAFVVMVSERQQRDLGDRLRRDGLTGLYTRTAFMDLAAAEAGLLRKHGYAVVLMDIDHFKRINDAFGHAGGDVVLAHAARMLTQLTRLSDLAVRYGGEEFCVLLHDCSPDEAARFSQRLVDEAGRQSVRVKDGSNVSFTFSVGYACVAPAAKAGGNPETLVEVIDRADKALYAAKAAGRNQVKSAADLSACVDVALTA